VEGWSTPANHVASNVAEPFQYNSATGYRNRVEISKITIGFANSAFFCVLSTWNQLVCVLYILEWVDLRCLRLAFRQAKTCLPKRIAMKTLMSRQHPSLLITDDDFDFRQTLKEAMESQGFRTLLAGDGEEALAVVRRETVHVALMDMHMPRLSGLETIRRVRELHARLPCILISAAMDQALAAEALQAHAHSVLTKPVRFTDLNSAIREALRTTYAGQDHQVE
jgi:CheY-like chemotaxis protein